MRTISRFYFTLDEAKIDLNTLVNQDEISNKLVKLVNLKFSDCWAICNDVEVNPWEFYDDYALEEPSVESVNIWKNKFKYIYETTVDKYNRLISLYQDNESKLMNSIKTETTTSSTNKGTHSGTNSGTDNNTRTGNNKETIADSNSEKGKDTSTLTKSGTNTDTDTTQISNSGSNNTTVSDNSAITLSGRDTTNNDSKHIVNDTPQVINENLSSDNYANLIEKNSGSNSTEYGKKETHSGDVKTVGNANSTETHSGSITHSLNTTDSNSLNHEKTNTITGSHTHTINEGDENTFSHNNSGEDNRTTSGSTITLDDRESIIDRLDKIHKHYDLLYKEWVEEFSGLFGEM